jgi:hypothetical protein
MVGLLEADPRKTAMEVAGKLLPALLSRQRYAELEAAIRARHPYELPEIVAVPLARSLPAYLDWVVAETAPA